MWISVKGARVSRVGTRYSNESSIALISIIFTVFTTHSIKLQNSPQPAMITLLICRYCCPSRGRVAVTTSHSWGSAGFALPRLPRPLSFVCFTTMASCARASLLPQKATPKRSSSRFYKVAHEALPGWSKCPSACFMHQGPSPRDVSSWSQNN